MADQISTVPVETRAVAKALLIAGNKILILRRSKTDPRRPLEWDIPGGAIDEGEDIKQACARECQEEAGITVSVSDFKDLYAMTEPVSDGVSCTFNFLRAFIPKSEVVLSYEHDQYRWVSFQEMFELFTYERHHRFLTYVRDHNLLAAKTND